jgi:hypothetical protein
METVGSLGATSNRLTIGYPCRVVFGTSPVGVRSGAQAKSVLKGVSARSKEVLPYELSDP